MDVNARKQRTNNQINLIDKVPITGPKEMEIYELSDKQFRMILLKEFSKYKNT